MKTHRYFFAGLLALSVGACSPNAMSGAVPSGDLRSISQPQLTHIQRCYGVQGPALSHGVVGATLHDNCVVNGNTIVTLAISLHKNGTRVASASATEHGPGLTFHTTANYTCVSGASSAFQAIGTVTVIFSPTDKQKFTYKTSDLTLMCS